MNGVQGTEIPFFFASDLASYNALSWRHRAPNSGYLSLYGAVGGSRMIVHIKMSPKALC